MRYLEELFSLAFIIIAVAIWLAWKFGRPVLERWGGPWLPQYHRVEMEPRFAAATVDDWLGIEPGRRCGVATRRRPRSWRRACGILPGR